MRAIPAELVRRYEAEGWWTQDTIGDLLERGLRSAGPDAAFRVHSQVRPWSGTLGEVEVVARRLAGGLRARGVGPGDVVAFQLPNWMEAAAVFWASAFLGAVVVPIVHFYGPKEVGYILKAVEPRVFVTAEEFGRMRFSAELCADVPIVGVVGRDFEDLLDADPMPGVLATDPAGPALIAFTSGTTRHPKGVVHSHQTLGFETRQLAERYPPDLARQLTSAPVGHFIGMVSAFLIPLLDGASINLADAWDPGRVLGLMNSDGLVVGGGVPYYITSLLDHPDWTPEHLQYMRYAGLGGSSVPVAVTTRLAGLGITVYRSYGSTEHPSITASLPTAPEHKRLHTDGKALPGVEIRLGEDGEIISRGPDLCLGYTDPALTEAAFDADGWYRTGDIGVLDEDGYLTITDRKSDFIIRGGENISALEVEEVLLTLPGVAEAVVVAAPDARLGEHAAAVVRLKPGHPAPTMDRLRAHFDKAGLAKQKWPEELHTVDDFPRTASGKVQKYVLRRDLAARGAVG
ncbi:Acyl-CoA synthetase (AMP-forming)/AMP-acid ligase II [Thermomonospora echinospora]|uniref:Acyl-CoA synthetase (AMP-forming)/AMP-acid ligase II n=1 Tax=Thermomonospora echinospora TaxID=1992 RepID=A0A1H6AXR2_9ACTN|nr:AMP-binding protein [Thermomonospora echinospora]SEG53341.1 Acyl-CoA synthetase (AMP-forming)/AMP-acid ligase II [Thermomonospora echinospora]